MFARLFGKSRKSGKYNKLPNKNNNKPPAPPVTVWTATTQNQMYYALEDKTPDELEKLVNARNENGETPLIVASKNGHEGAVRHLLQKGADINAKDHDDNTSLMLACIKGRGPVVHELVDNISPKVKINEQNKKGQTALILAVENGKSGDANTLISNTANVFLKDNEGETVFYVACKKGDTYIVNQLLKKYPYPKEYIEQYNKGGKSRDDLLYTKVDNGKTPLFIAVENKHLHIINRLLDFDIEKNVMDKEGNTPIDIALDHCISQKNKEDADLALDILEKLLDKPSNFHDRWLKKAETITDKNLKNKVTKKLEYYEKFIKEKYPENYHNGGSRNRTRRRLKKPYSIKYLNIK